MNHHRIKLIMEGLHEDDGHVRLSAFARGVKSLEQAVYNLDKLISKGKQSNYFKVVRLSHGSPSTVECEVCQYDGLPDTRDELMSEINNTFTSISRGSIPPYTDRDVLKNLQILASPVGEDIGTVRIQVADETTEIDKSFAAFITYTLAGEESMWGTVEGQLERINIHKGVNRFFIYPLFGPTHIRCHFGSELKDTAIAAIDRRVSISGKVKYKALAPYPHAIDAHQIDIYPEEKDLPTFEDLRGIAPEITDGVPSEQFIAERRDEW